MTAAVLTGPPPTLSLTDQEAFREQGFLVVRGLFAPAEMAMVSMEAERLLGRDDLKHTNNIRCRWQNHVETGAYGSLVFGCGFGKPRVTFS